MLEKGILIIVSGPSGTGKGTVVNLLCERKSGIKTSISATTRAPRIGEVEGKNYFFKSKEEFLGLIENDELLEWVEYCNNFYGTLKNFVEDTLKQGLDVLLEIEVEGALKIKEKYNDAVLIFVLPPSLQELRRRIENRATEKIDTINQRLNKAITEIEFINKYDYVIINKDIEEAAREIESIAISEKLKVNRNLDIVNFIKNDGR